MESTLATLWISSAMCLSTKCWPEGEPTMKWSQTEVISWLQRHNVMGYIPRAEWKKQNKKQH